MNDPTTLKVGAELTKVTVIEELARTKECLSRLSGKKDNCEIILDFDNVKKVDTLAVVYILQIDRLLFKGPKNLKIMYRNLPKDLVSLLNLTSLSKIVSDER